MITVQAEILDAVTDAVLECWPVSIAGLRKPTGLADAQARFAWMYLTRKILGWTHNANAQSLGLAAPSVVRGIQRAEHLLVTDRLFATRIERSMSQLRRRGVPLPELS